MNVRIIPRLDIKNEFLVKGIHLEGLRVLGNPVEFARYYYENGADELLYMDIVASLYERNSILQIVKATSSEIFIPLTVGGGLRNIEDIRDALRMGADKVAINTAAINNPVFISESAKTFGSSTIVVSIEAKKMKDGNYEAYTDNGREKSGREVVDWAMEAVELGAGEIMITSVDNEGTGKGFECELIKNVVQSVPVPVIACGGSGYMEHVTELFNQCEPAAAGIASMFHYSAINSGIISQGSREREFSIPANIDCEVSIRDLKEKLQEQKISCRI